MYSNSSSQDCYHLNATNIMHCNYKMHVKELNLIMNFALKAGARHFIRRSLAQGKNRNVVLHYNTVFVLNMFGMIEIPQQE